MYKITDTRITKVETVGGVNDVGAFVAKSMPAHARYRYKQALIYTLEDGRQMTGDERGLTRPKLQQAIERKVEYARGGALFATFHDGRFTGTAVKFSLMLA